MNNDLRVPANIKDTKYREYFEHLHEIIDKQSKEISVKDQLFRIQNLNFYKDLKDLTGEMLTLLWDDQFSSIRIIIKKHEGQSGELLYSLGIGNKSDSYAYLDSQIEEQLGEPGILYISDTSKIHSIKFVPGNSFPKTILGISLGEDKKNHGLVWFACENQKNFSKHESDKLFSFVGVCSTVIKNCVEWNEKSKALLFQNEILDRVNFPILILSQSAVLFSNLAAKQSFNKTLDNINESKLLLNNVWKFSVDSKNLITINNRDYKVAIIEDDLISSKNVRAAIFTDETLLKKQQEYLTVVMNSISQGLRSTLNLILGSAKMLPLVGGVNDHQKDYIKGIQSKAEESLNAIEDLLEIERIIEGEGLKLEGERIKSIVDISISLVGHLTKQKHISIINMIPNSEDVINLDQVLFTQMLANIFEFAVGNTNLNGEITIGAEKNSNHWKILIKDNSNGLSQVEVDRLNSLDHFNEVPQTLRLAKKIINFHRGTFVLQSDLGKGNKYLIEIPF